MKLCRFCRKSDENFINIFKTEGLKHKIETCLPIIIVQHSLMPETICQDCNQNINHFYQFNKSCLENTIILESKLDIIESCLKTNRKTSKSCQVKLIASASTECKNIQTDDSKFRSFPFKKRCFNENSNDNNLIKTRKYEKTSNSCSLVDYDDILSNSSSDNDDEDLIKNNGHVVLCDKSKALSHFYDVANNILKTAHHELSNYHQPYKNLMSKIVERENSNRSKSHNSFIGHYSYKICQFDTSRRRKCKQPRKIIKCTDNCMEENISSINKNEEPIEILEINNDIIRSIENQLPNEYVLPQQCFLCNVQISGITELVNHFFEYHVDDYMSRLHVDNPNIDNNLLENKQKMCDKITEIQDEPPMNHQLNENHRNSRPCSPPSPVNIQCPNCSKSLTEKNDLFKHLQLEHSKIATHLCGNCLKQMDSLESLRSHLEQCVLQQPFTTKFYCQHCYFGDSKFRTMENHILTHEFLIENCRVEHKNFDPENYIKVNTNFHIGVFAGNARNFTCMDCGNFGSDSYNEFWMHRKKMHSIFHCHLCAKYYRRNSQLLKHTKRVHQNHPSITCQICYETNSSKYQLAQHFSKMHKIKSESVIKVLNESDESVSTEYVDKEDFVKQDLVDGKTQNDDAYYDDSGCNNNCINETNDHSMNTKTIPKEIDRSHDLFRNIITNYTPPPNAGGFECPKCSKKFSKKNLLRKHKQNCRPKLQKDLLTRCKSCSRIFKDRQSLAKHLINYHWKYVCEICDETMQSKCEIVAHIRFHHPSSHLICNICQNILRCKKDLLEHLGNHDNSYVCQFCGDMLLTQMRLKMHILSLHRKILSLSCGICLKLFENQKVLRDHVIIIHKNQLDPVTSCTVCGKHYGSKWKTYEHINKSHGSVFKPCKLCLELCESDDQLEHHFKIKHTDEFNNGTVTAKTSQSTSINNTTVLAKGNTNFDTDDSQDSQNNTEDTENNTQTSDSEDDENDENEHSDKCEEKPKHITVDNLIKQERIFFSKSRLKRNSKRTVYLNSNVPSCCEICRKTWPAKKHLWQHYIRCHKLEAATVCGICLKTNKSYEILQTHLNSMHPTLLYGQGIGSNFICRICGRYHNASSKLQLHMGIHDNFDWKLLVNNEMKMVNLKATKTEKVNNKITQSAMLNTLNEECSNNISFSEPDCKRRKIDLGIESDENHQINSVTNTTDNSEDSTSMSSKETSRNHPDSYGSSNTEESQESYQNYNPINTDYIKENNKFIKLEIKEESLEKYVRDIFKPKPEELDTAIKSISLQNDESPILNQYTEEYDSLESANCLNDVEIESAVGSIL